MHRKAIFVLVNWFLKNLSSGTQCERFPFLLILDPWSVSFHAAVVFGLGKNFLFKSTLGHCPFNKDVAPGKNLKN